MARERDPGWAEGAANDPIRATDRDRGLEKNWLADILGVGGELVALRRIGMLTDADVLHRPIAFARFVDEVDLRVRCGDGELLLEAKAHFLQAGKSWFRSTRAHERSKRRGAFGYVPTLTAIGARRALVGALLTVAQLDGWGAPDRRLRDPAIGVPLADVCQQQLERSLDDAKQLIEPEGLITARELGVLAARAGRELVQWRERLPVLETLGAREVVDAVLATELDIPTGS